VSVTTAAAVPPVRDPPRPAATATPTEAPRPSAVRVPSAAAPIPPATAKPAPVPVSAPVLQIEVESREPTPPPAVTVPRSERVSKKKTEHLAAARAQMAAQLAEVAHQAANSESAKREERKSERIAKGENPETARMAARNAVLTGQGERQHREHRQLWLIVGVVAVIALLLAVVLNLRSAVRGAIDTYAGPVSFDQNRYPVLGDVVRARAWLVSASSMPSGPVLASNLADAELGSERIIELTPLQPVFAELKGLRLDAALGLWVAASDLEKVRGVAAGKTGEEASRLLTAARLRHVVHKTMMKKLSVSDDDAVIITDLLTGTPPRDGEPFAQRLLDQGELPTRLVIRPFRGRSGSLMIDIGRPPYRALQGAYEGRLMRIEGDRWPIGWRVLSLAQVK